MTGLIRMLRGTVRFRVTGRFPERFINLCANKGLPLWDSARREDGYHFTTWPTIYKRLRPCAKKAGCRLRVEQRRGLPFLTHRYRKRWGIAVGAAVFFVFICVMSLFVWNIQVSGNVVLDSRQILEQLEELGVKAGSLRSGIDARDVERQMMLRLNELGWIAVNIQGSTAHIRIKERVMPPPQIDSQIPCNVVAKQAGQIERMEVYEGQNLVKQGDAVAQGDVLVSGVVEDKKQEIHLVHARARVMAKVEIELSSTVEYEQIRYEYIGALRRHSLRMFSLELPLWVGKPPVQPYKLERSYTPLSVAGLSLPVDWGLRQYMLLQEEPYTLTSQQALALAEEELLRQEGVEFSQCEILEKEVQAEEGEDALVLKGRYMVLMDIAKEAEIFTD